MDFWQAGLGLLASSEISLADLVLLATCEYLLALSNTCSQLIKILLAFQKKLLVSSHFAWQALVIHSMIFARIFEYRSHP
ncbi:hypothetical protein JOC77_000073 [Peribacillus deserti]|uniref:Uncharacterized protein n=1 Tax=Peribacillus deserti TaxID=673318 RepID=A0ABS2QCG0_9BACI|nr:hypothetical protein [Peribacillus deserti]MBM7690670.1 hypothetical protein [Peribacillus deserti]